MEWKVIAFESQRGENIIRDFLVSLELKARSKMSHLISLLVIYGPYLGMPYSKRITKELLELRVRGKEEIRMLYGFKNHTIYLLHGFKKKTQKPHREK